MHVYIKSVLDLKENAQKSVQLYYCQTDLAYASTCCLDEDDFFELILVLYFNFQTFKWSNNVADKG